MSRPNILLVQTDQMAASALPCYGNPVVRAPILERLAAEGAVIDEGYCNFPLCAPSRFSMMSGQLCSTIGAYDNGAEFRSEIPTFAHYLRALGYKTCLAGKMHFIGADQLHGFAERVTSDIYPGDFIWSPNWEKSIQKDTNGPMLVEETGGCDDSPQIAYDDQVAARASAWLEARGGEEEPFMLTVSFTHPHDPYVCAAPYWDLYEGVDIPMPTSRVLPDAHAGRLMAQYGIDAAAVTDAQVRDARRGYYGSVSYIDAKIGEVLDALRRSGRDQDTIVIVTSDHGDMLGEKGLWMKKVFYEGSLKVPLIFWRPGLIPARRVMGQASLVDLLPTMLGFAGSDGTTPIEPIEPLEGDDLSDVLRSSDTVLPNRKVRAEITCEGTPGVMLCVRDGRHKFVWSAIDPPQLYDLEDDPDESVNRADDPALGDVRAAMLADIEAHWDVDALDRAVRESQKRRHFIVAAHQSAGGKPDWDFRESDGSDGRWMRGTESYNDWAYGTITGFRR
jgi:choline-sulfatase